jgi:hypothetical protein
VEYRRHGTLFFATTRLHGDYTSRPLGRLALNGLAPPQTRQQRSYLGLERCSQRRCLGCSGTVPATTA